MTRQELLDRVEIEALIANYSAAVDGHDWDLFDEVFVPDGEIDYTEVGGIRGDRDTVRAWLAAALPPGRCYYHLMGAARARLGGDVSEFEPFTRPDIRLRNSQGGGLGLSIVTSVVNVCRRQLRAEALPDGGMKISVRLPTATMAPHLTGSEPPVM